MLNFLVVLRYNHEFAIQKNRFEEEVILKKMKLFPKEDFESALVKDMGSEMYISPTAHYNVFRQVSLNNAIIRAENKQKDKLVK